MEYLCLSIGTVAALTIAWQDFNDRLIHVLGLLVFGLAGLGFTSLNQGAFSGIASSLLLVSFMILAVILFLRLRHAGSIMDRLLGWGDVVMFFGLACWFEPLQFLCFFTSSMLLLSLGFGLALLNGKIDAQYPIPLAGALAICFLLYLPLSLILIV